MKINEPYISHRGLQGIWPTLQKLNTSFCWNMLFTESQSDFTLVCNISRRSRPHPAWKKQLNRWSHLAGIVCGHPCTKFVVAPILDKYWQSYLMDEITEFAICLRLLCPTYGLLTDVIRDKHKVTYWSVGQPTQTAHHSRSSNFQQIFVIIHKI